MKKSTVLVIFIIYVVSIVVIGFFGMSVKVYDEIKYIKSIEMSVEAESDDMYTFTQNENDNNGNNIYTLILNFSKAIKDADDKLFLPVNLIPKVIYESEDVADAKAESVKFTLSDQFYSDKGFVSLSDNGTLICYDYDISFEIYIKPASRGRIGSGATVVVWIFAD